MTFMSDTTMSLDLSASEASQTPESSKMEQASVKSNLLGNIHEKRIESSRKEVSAFRQVNDGLVKVESNDFQEINASNRDGEAKQGGKTSIPLDRNIQPEQLISYSNKNIQPTHPLESMHGHTMETLEAKSRCMILLPVDCWKFHILPFYEYRGHFCSNSLLRVNTSLRDACMKYIDVNCLDLREVEVIFHLQRKEIENDYIFSEETLVNRLSFSAEKEMILPAGAGCGRL